MNIIDLTHYIDEKMPVFSGTEKPIIKYINTIEKDGFRESKISIYSHIGTHIDAPAHILPNGLYLNDFPIEKFIGKSSILDFSNYKSKLIELDTLKKYEEKIKNSEFIIIKTGWSKYWGDKKYYENFPSLSEESAKYLSGFKLKGIGVDTMSIDSMDSTNFSIHNTLMNENIIIIENLTNLDSIVKDYFTLSIFPLKTKKADGSPVRAIALEEF